MIGSGHETNEKTPPERRSHDGGSWWKHQTDMFNLLTGIASRAASVIAGALWDEAGPDDARIVD
jgi:hypothetical protein